MKEYRIEESYIIKGEMYSNIWVFVDRKLINLIKNVKRNSDLSINKKYGTKLNINWCEPQFVY